MGKHPKIKGGVNSKIINNKRIHAETKKAHGELIPITPKFLLKKDVCEYVGKKQDLFREVSRKYGLSIYAYGTKKIWYKVYELDEMMESFLIKKKNNDRTTID